MKTVKNKSFTEKMKKVEKDGYHNGCRKCSECGRGAYYMSDYPIYVNVETGKHVICPSETSPYSSAFIKSADALDIR